MLKAQGFQFLSSPWWLHLPWDLGGHFWAECQLLWGDHPPSHTSAHSQLSPFSMFCMADRELSIVLEYYKTKPKTKNHSHKEHVCVGDFVEGSVVKKDVYSTALQKMYILVLTPISLAVFGLSVNKSHVTLLDSPLSSLSPWPLAAQNKKKKNKRILSFCRISLLPIVPTPRLDFGHIQSLLHILQHLLQAFHILAPH